MKQVNMRVFAEYSLITYSSEQGPLNNLWRAALGSVCFNSVLFATWMLLCSHALPTPLYAIAWQLVKEAAVYNRYDGKMLPQQQFQGAPKRDYCHLGPKEQWED